MQFPRKLLADHEKIVFDLRPHWLSALPPALWTVGLFLGWLILFRMAGEYVDDADLESWIRNALGVIILAAWIWLAVIPWLRWRYTHFVLTTDRLITRQGIIAKHSKEIPLERINDVAFSQTVMERFLGAGDLFVESAGERGQTRIDSVRKPEEVQLQIYTQTEENNNRMMTPRAPLTSEAQRAPTPVEQLEALGRLKEQGILTDEEFDAKKKALLEQI